MKSHSYSINCYCGVHFVPLVSEEESITGLICTIVYSNYFCNYGYFAFSAMCLLWWQKSNIEHFSGPAAGCLWCEKVNPQAVFCRLLTCLRFSLLVLTLFHLRQQCTVDDEEVFDCLSYGLKRNCNCLTFPLFAAFSI